MLVVVSLWEGNGILVSLDVGISWCFLDVLAYLSFQTVDMVLTAT